MHMYAVGVQRGGNNGPDSGVDDTAQCAIYNREECSGDPACTYDSKCAFCKSKVSVHTVCTQCKCSASAHGVRTSAQVVVAY